MPAGSGSRRENQLTQVFEDGPRRGAIHNRRSLINADRICVIVLILLSALTWAPRWRGPLDLRWDASVYYVLGTSLAEGEGYRLLNEPGEIQAIQYPPLLPALIALHQKVLGTSDPFVVTAGLKYVWVLLFVVLVVCTYLIVRRFADWTWALLAGVSVALNFNLHLHFNQCTAELPYTAVTMLFLATWRTHASTLREVMQAIAGIAAFFLRTIGIALLVAWVLDGLIRKQFRRAAVRLVLSVACVAMWQGYIAGVESSPLYDAPAYAYQRADYLFYNVSYSRNVSYVDPYRPELGRASISDLRKRIVAAASMIPRRLGETITSYAGMWEMQGRSLLQRFGRTLAPSGALSVVFFLLGLGALLGLCLLVSQREWLIPLYFGATVLGVCAAPWPGQHVRYLCPVLPVLLLGLVTSLRALSATGRQVITTKGQLSRLFAGAVIGIVFIHQIIAYYQAHTYMLKPSLVRNRSGRQIVQRQLGYEQDLVAMDQGIGWLGEHAQPGDMVAGAMPQWIYLQTGLKAVMPPLESDPAVAARLLDSLPVRYLMHEKAGFFSWSYVDSILRAYPDNWRLIFTSEDNYVKIYERVAIH